MRAIVLICGKCIAKRSNLKIKIAPAGHGKRESRNTQRENFSANLVVHVRDAGRLWQDRHGEEKEKQNQSLASPREPMYPG